MSAQKRTIRTDYHTPEGVKKTTSCNANRAVATCVGYMQINHHGARVAEVWDSETGVLHAVIKRKISGNIEIMYHRNPLDYQQPLRLAYGAIAG